MRVLLKVSPPPRIVGGESGAVLRMLAHIIAEERDRLRPLAEERMRQRLERNEVAARISIDVRTRLRKHLVRAIGQLRSPEHDRDENPRLPPLVLEILL